MRKICLRVPQKDAWSACRKDFYPKYLRGYLRGKAQKFPPIPPGRGGQGFVAAVARWAARGAGLYYGQMDRLSGLCSRDSLL